MNSTVLDFIDDVIEYIICGRLDIKDPLPKVDDPEVKAYVKRLKPQDALKVYDTFTRYLAYENTIFWTRSQHFLVAHSALLALFGVIVFGKGVVSQPNALSAFAACFVCLIGVCLSVLWHRALTSGEFWTSHWQDILRELEPVALGPIPAFRKFDSGRRFVRAICVARHCALLFFLAWIMGGALILYFANA